MHDNALPVGAVVSGRYRILKVLGQGGFGITYLVRDEYLATKLALKECFPEQCVIRDANGSQSVIPLPTKEELFHKLKEKFIGEARTIFGLHGDVHVEGIVHVYNVEEANNTGYMAMEYLDGETLESYLNAQGPVDCIWLLTLVKPVLLALQCIHTQGLLHRDIAPDNLMLIQRNGKEKLVLFDFGAIKEVAKGATTIMIAKPGYSPPEQYDPKTELTWATDIYALCATLYAMLGGSVPADATTRLSGIVLARKDPLIGLHELNAQIPQEVESIIAKGMQLDAAKRYQSANEMAEDVERFLKKKQSIAVEYYYNSILGKTEYVQKQAHSRLDIEQLKTEEPDFVLSKTENLPLQVSFDDNENIVRLYYISRRTASCTIEYYYDDAVEKEILTGLIVGSQVSYQDKPKPEFFFDHAENAPLTVGKNADKNIIRVYYRSVANVTCKIEYYYDHKLDEAATLTFTGKVGDYFSYQGYEKPRDMYRFDCAKNDPLILSSNPEENIIRVYYSQKTVLLESNYIFHYCYDGIENTAEKTVQPLNGNDLDQAAAKHAREKENYRLVYQEVNSTSPGAVDITYYYESCKATEPQSSLSVKMSGEIRKNVNFAHRDAALGDVIRYTLKVTNTGNIDLKDIVVSILDEKSQGVYVSQSFSLQPGSQKKITYQYTVEKHDALNEQVVMKAVASGNCPWSKKTVVAKADCTLKVRPLNKPHKATKRWWIALASLLVMAGCVAFFVPHLQTHDAEPQYAVGDYVTFGAYPQTAEGTDETPIEWLVLDKNGNKVLLLSRYGLDVQLYHTSCTSITWENCTLRTWLNHDFMNRAFTAAEQSAILLSNVDNSSSQCYSNWSSKSGNNTQDKVFLLSYAEANKYLGVTYDDSNNTKSRVTPTAYAISQGAWTSDSNKTTDGEAAGWWWLRSPGSNQRRAADVDTDGSLGDRSVNNERGCVRPALWVNLESAGNLIHACENVDKQSKTDEASPTVTAQNTKVTVGDYVTFGAYPQTAEGTDETPIEWLVLDRDGDKALLLSRYGLDVQLYHTSYTSITWENCTLRTWLNDDFINRAFTAAERSAILLTNVDNSSIQCYSGWSTSGGNNTQDKVFLLSYAEANKYLGVNYVDSSNTNSRVSPTAYAISQGAWTSDSNKTADGEYAGWWWLRSPGSNRSSAADVDTDGSLGDRYVNNERGSDRPALWVNLGSGIF